MPENQNSNENQTSNENQNSYNYNPNRPQKSQNGSISQPNTQNVEENNHEDTKKVVDAAARVAAEAYAPGVGGEVYDAAKNAPVIGGAINQAEEKVAAAADKIPGVKKATKAANDSGLTDAASAVASANSSAASSAATKTAAMGGANTSSANSLNMPSRKNTAMQSRINNGEAETMAQSSGSEQSLDGAENTNTSDVPSENNTNPEDLPVDNIDNDEEQEQSGNKDNKAEGKSDILGQLAKKVWEKHKFTIIIAGGGGLFLFLIILVALMGGSGSSSLGTIGLGGYNYVEIDNVCETVYVYDTSSGDDGTYSLEEYVAGVVAAEVGGFQNSVVYETLAIAARTYALNRLQNSSDCSIAGNATVQAFRKTDNEDILAAANNTRGLVITINGSIFSTEYDAFCYSSKDSNYYTIQADLQIPTAWVEANVSSWSYKNCACNLNDTSITECWSNGSWTDGGHGRGLSQYGTYYLATELGYSKEEILELFYGEDIEIMSIYPSVYTGEYPIDPNDTLYQNLAILKDESLESLLTRNGSSIEELDAYLANVVETSGVGTREAVVNVAVSLIGALAEMGYKLNYQWGGKYYNIGVNPSWGLESSYNVCSSYAAIYGSSTKCLTQYKWLSFDCSGLVHWAIANAFQVDGYSNLSSQGLYLAYTYNTTSLKSNEAVCQAGDVLYKAGYHVALVVGVDDTNKKYIVAEATGSDIYKGTGGVKLSYYNYDASGYVCGKLDNIYEEE